jgi:hypothetical protein
MDVEVNVTGNGMHKNDIGMGGSIIQELGADLGSGLCAS